MHVVQVYHNRVPVPLYGGMERVIVSLCQGLIELGHRVTLISFQGHGQIPGVSHQYLDQFSSMEEAEKRYVELIPSDADVLHFHLPHMVKSAPLKSIVTMHGNLREHESAESLPPQTIFLSGDHARRHGREKFVFNGLNPAEIPISLTPIDQRSHFAFLGRASLKRKGLHHAKYLAKSVGHPLQIGGGRGLPWFGYKYLGQLDDRQKFELLGSSRALLFPIEWDEPFGLVMIEAMFCGTPVYAFARGSVAEVLGEKGHEGLFLLAANRQELRLKMQQLSDWPAPMDLRNYAVAHFSHIKMVEHYLDYYRTA